MVLHQSGWLAGAVVAVAAVAYSALRTRTRRDAARRRAAVWGSAQARRGDFDQVARYHRMLVEEYPIIAAAALADQEWHDLGMDSVYAELDRTTSGPGQQALYHRLRTPARTDEELSRLGRLETSVIRFGDDIASRERAQATLARLNDSAAYSLPRLFLGKMPPKPRFAWLFLPLAVAPLVAIAGTLAGVPHGWVIVLGLLGVNYVVRSIVAADIAWIAQPVNALHALLNVADRLADESKAGESIESTRRRLRSLRQITAMTGLVDGSGDDVLRAGIDYLNMLFLVDVNVCMAALRACERHRLEIRAVFEWVGDTDVALSVASFRSGRADWCRPTILPRGSGLTATAAAHPLVADARANDVSIQPGRGIVITGSNMSGKTTLLRTLGVNALLAQSIHTCIAARFACPPLVIRTAITTSDNILAGESYYLAEARNALDMLSDAGNGQRLFLIDELFRGTNTTERIAAGVAVMEMLVRGSNMAIVATHDAEVVTLVGGCYDPQHFTESVTDAGFQFDFILRPGLATQRNAVSLLRVLGAPDALFDRATELCAQIEAGRRPDSRP
ncbi:MAG: hypothetical protein ABI035_05260 [Gemmatimonadaceae bacterium]